MAPRHPSFLPILLAVAATSSFLPILLAVAATSMEEVIIKIDDLHLHGSATFVSGIKKPLIIVNLLNSPSFLPIILAVAATSIFSIFLGILWKWLLFLILICSTQLIVAILTYFVEQLVVIKNHKALFFVFPLKTSLDHLFWSASILFSWFLSTRDVENTKIIHFVTTTFATFVLWMGMCTLKIVILKVLACRFHDRDFFHNIQDFIFQEHVLQTLLGGGPISDDRIRPVLKSIKTVVFKMVQLVRSTSSFTNTNYDVSDHRVDTVVSLVFKNLTNNEPRNIQETDLLPVMMEEDIATVLNLFEGAAATKCINETSLTDWMVKVCNNRKALVHLLNDTPTVIKQLDKIVSVTLVFLVAVLWYLLMDFGTTKFLGYDSSHMLVLVWVFITSYYGKSIWEGIMLAFVNHPFNIGDHCIIDNEQLVVEDIKLFETVFLKENNEKTTCSNSVLLSKFITNLNQSPLTKDTLELVVSSTTSAETIEALKLKMDELVRDKSWCGGYSLDLKGIEDVRHTYVLEVTHVTNFENYKQKKSRKSKLIFYLCKLFEELEIKDFSIQ